MLKVSRIPCRRFDPLEYETLQQVVQLILDKKGNWTMADLAGLLKRSDDNETLQNIRKADEFIRYAAREFSLNMVKELFDEAEKN